MARCRGNSLVLIHVRVVLPGEATLFPSGSASHSNPLCRVATAKWRRVQMSEAIPCELFWPWLWVAMATLTLGGEIQTVARMV